MARGPAVMANFRWQFVHFWFLQMTETSVEERVNFGRRGESICFVFRHQLVNNARHPFGDARAKFSQRSRLFVDDLPHYAVRCFSEVRAINSAESIIGPSSYPSTTRVS